MSSGSSRMSRGRTAVQIGSRHGGNQVPLSAWHRAAVPAGRTAGESYPPHLGIVARSRGVPGRIRRQSAGLALGQVDVAFVAEEDSAAPHVFVLIDGAGGVPEVGGQLAVSAGEEGVALGIVLADEQDVGCVAAGAQVGVAPPPGEEGVVAAELVVVLVGAAGAVVLDQKEPRVLRSIVGDV